MGTFSWEKGRLSEGRLLPLKPSGSPAILLVSPHAGSSPPPLPPTPARATRVLVMPSCTRLVDRTPQRTASLIEDFLGREAYRRFQFSRARSIETLSFVWKGRERMNAYDAARSAPPSVPRCSPGHRAYAPGA